jgi:hypothetical protein
MKKYIHISLILCLVLMISGCVQFQDTYGSIKILPGTGAKVSIRDLIDKWEDYNIYYAGYGVRLPLGVWFDPKDNDTSLVGDLWKPVRDKKTLIEITQWIYPTTQYEPYLTEILGPRGRFYGYLYYSYGMVVLKKIDKNKMYVLDLERPQEEGLGTDMH